MRLRSLIVVSTIALLGCDRGPGPDVCRDVRSDVTCTKLSGFALFTGDGSAQEPAEGVIPFEPNSALFSDYAFKSRFLYVPPGQTVKYAEDDPFDLPEGSILAKTFWFPADARQPDGDRRIIETRLLIHKPEGWVAMPYVWDEKQREATLQKVGATVDVQWVHTDGQPRQVNYVVPNANQCKECHEDDHRVMHTIGLKARHMNRNHVYDGRNENQIDYLSRLGMLKGAPPSSAAPRLPVWNDPSTGTVAERARAWLEINCAHCHNPDGQARTSGLDLQYSVTNMFHLGECKPPVAAGRGSGGRQFNIVPGKPDESILVFRIESTMPDVMMPETGRRLPHKEGIELIRQWISEMTGACEKP